MRFFKKILSVVLVLSLLCLYFPKIGMAGQSRLVAKANTATNITKHKPEILAPPEENIPLETAAKPKSNWLWYVLGGVVLVGAIAAAGGGGGGGDGAAPPPNTGSVSVNW